jgi:hypothetical protein
VVYQNRTDCPSRAIPHPSKSGSHNISAPRPPFIAEHALGQISPLASEAVQLHLRGPSHEGVVFREQRSAETALPGQLAFVVARYAPYLFLSGIGDGLFERDELDTFRDELFK